MKLIKMDTSSNVYNNAPNAQCEDTNTIRLASQDKKYEYKNNSNKQYINKTIKKGCGVDAKEKEYIVCNNCSAY
mgnify:CR=1 FL=1